MALPAVLIAIDFIVSNLSMYGILMEHFIIASAMTGYAFAGIVFSLLQIGGSGYTSGNVLWFVLSLIFTYKLYQMEKQRREETVHPMGYKA